MEGFTNGYIVGLFKKRWEEESDGINKYENRIKMFHLFAYWPGFPSGMWNDYWCPNRTYLTLSNSLHVVSFGSLENKLEQAPQQKTRCLQFIHFNFVQRNNIICLNSLIWMPKKQFQHNIELENLAKVSNSDAPWDWNICPHSALIYGKWWQRDCALVSHYSYHKTKMHD